MSDIVERLRAACDGHPHAKIEWPHRVLHEAAAEITRLRVEVERLRAVVKNSSNAIETLASQMPPPNMFTSAFISIAIGMLAVAPEPHE